MNSLWCFLFLAIALVEGKAVLYTVPKQYVEVILKAASECIDSSKVGSDAVQKVIAANLEDSEPFKKFLHCFSSKAGYVDDNGHFIVDQMTNLIGDHKEKSAFIDALNLCNKIDGGNAYETLYKSALCFRDNSPIYFTI